ncbi:MAG: site-2 protease family protein [Actinomycetota bacterium]|nr:site-2 protease family protein [Actinomycetota bacterium]HZY64787.1 site-2 protease family protein [Rubrobacteraceae bacterium]
MIISLFEQFPAFAVAIVTGFIVGITLHEAAHAYSAYRLGDDTAYQQGRVTLNPFSHLDLLGSLMLLMAGFGWGKPTPIMLSKLRGGVFGPVIVALAGPVSNLFILAVCSVLIQIPSLQSGYPALIIIGVAFVNALLFVFNLIPIPPLDGSKIIFPFLPRALDGFVNFMNHYGPMILLGLVVLLWFAPTQYSPLSLILSLVRPLLNLFGIPWPFG